MQHVAMRLALCVKGCDYTGSQSTAAYLQAPHTTPLRPWLLQVGIFK